MELVKKSENVEFDIIYNTGEKVRVQEGILFEAKPDGKTMFHIGTSRANVFDAFFNATIEMMDAIIQKNKIKYEHAIHLEKYKSVHICKPIRENRMQGIKIVELNNMQGWYLVDESVQIKGQNGACYGTAIICCPFCGEQL